MTTDYVLNRLALALHTALEHPEPEVRARARAKAARWQAIVEGMAAGTLTIGSRTPVAGTPAWVTLEVVHGGFASGRYLAEGDLLEHERELLAKLPTPVPGDTPRERLNHWYLGDEGQADLSAALDASRCAIELPEEGALPVVVALLERGHELEALELIEQLRPWMHRLRFYPRLGTQPRPAGACVRRHSVGLIGYRLVQRTPPAQVSAMNEALSVWTPLFDRLVVLWLDTIEGEWPWLERDDAGKVCVTGGWPCSRFPADWAERRAAWLADYRRASTKHALCSKHRQRKSNFARLRSALERCARDSTKLDAREVGWLRRALANTLTKQGAPATERRDRLRRIQAQVAARPLHADLAAVLGRRMFVHDKDAGLPTLDGLDAPAGVDEHERVPAGTPIPAYLLAKAEQALEAPIAELIERGVIPSSEVLAQVLPQISAQVLAAGLRDPALRELYGRIYAAFRRRRSLLLLDLASQVRLEELPWVAALAPLREPNLEHAVAARQTLEDLTIMALSAFPHTLTPNPLVRELNALIRHAGLALPLVEEIAADIFAGVFTDKWARAAECAATLLDGTLYARYYDLPLPGDRRLTNITKRGTQRIAQDFTQLCVQRSGDVEAARGRSYVASNGVVIEQSQILTTHNLAVLIDGLGLRERVRPLAPSLAAKVFAWIVARQLPPADEWHARLQLVKNVAYAWRQAIFFLSLCERAEQVAVMQGLAEALTRASGNWAHRLVPAYEGLRLAFDGQRFDADGRDPAGGPGRRLLGWSLGGHWLLD